MEGRITNDRLKAFGMRSGESGFSMLEILGVILVISIVCTFAVMNITKAKQDLSLSGLTRELAGYLEKARVDAIRRHCTTATPCTPATSVQILDTNTYRVTMDFGGIGVATTRDLTLPQGSRFTAPVSLPTTIIFDWRGRPASAVAIVAQNRNGVNSRIDVTGSGDITIDHPVIIPNINVNVSLP